MSARWRFVAALLGALLFARAPAQACGPFTPIAIFWFRDRPNVAIERFVEGDLGILDAELAPPYRFIAYRYVSELGLDETSRAALLPLFGAPSPTARRWGESDATGRWLAMRRQVAGAPTDDDIDVDTWVIHQRNGETVHYFFRNCLEDAFDNATSTLHQRITALGAESPEVVAWAAAQDRVFTACSHRGEPPPLLGDDSTPAARADRDYQIAAAVFYLSRFEEAESLFRAIAADERSPWRQTAALLIARCRIRRGVLAMPVDTEALRGADAELAAIENDPQLDTVQASAKRLRAYAANQLDPLGGRRQLAARLLQPKLDPDAAQQFVDYRLIESSAEAEQGNAFRLWLNGHPCPNCAGTTPLLEEVASAVSSKGAQIRGMPGPEAGQARLTLAYYWARHLAWQAAPDRDPAAAAALLDRLLAGELGEVSLGDRNRLLAARAPLATSLEEYLRLSQLVPVGMKMDEIGPVPAEKQTVLLSDDTLAAIAEYFPLAVLQRTLEARELTEPLARRVALYAWVKTNLIGDEAAAEKLWSLLRPLVPEMAPDLDVWSDASGAARRFAFALSLLRFPGAQPYLGESFGRETPIGQIDGLGDNWWCSETRSSTAQPDTSIDALAPPAFLTPDELAAAARVREQMATVESAPEALGTIVFEWARTHSDDPRVPEALHRLVKTTRYGYCRGTGEISRRAFNLLHKRYPDSPWTKQTPFWFGG